jgi:hypothetical protein
VSICDAPSIYTDNALSDGTAGSAINMRFGRRYFFGSPTVAKSYRWLSLTGTPRSSGAATLTATASTSGSQSYTFSSEWGAGTTQKVVYMPLAGNGPSMDIDISDTGTGGLPEFASLELEGVTMGRR